ncbi:MAG TPA: hypothetical protein VGM29_12300, partial [Polyangiaceae bacterium]
QEKDAELSRLLRTGSELEKGVLGSALEDRPAPERRKDAFAQVLDAARKRRERRWLAPVGISALCAAAATALLLPRGTPRPALPVSAEPTPALAASPTKAHPAASASGASSASAFANGFVPCSPVSVAEGSSPLIDDFEDGDTRLPLLEHRAGNWVVFNDATSTQQPRPGSMFPAQRLDGRGSSHFGLHMAGGKFTKWGATLAIELSPRRCYDASVYSGIEFWARGHGSMRPTVKMTQVVSEEYGGSCLHDCFDAHGTLLALARDWRLYRLPWSELKQRGFGEQVPFDARSLFSIEFEVAPEQTPFDFWIDDLSFAK